MVTRYKLYLAGEIKNHWDIKRKTRQAWQMKAEFYKPYNLKCKVSFTIIRINFEGGSTNKPGFQWLKLAVLADFACF